MQSDTQRTRGRRPRMLIGLEGFVAVGAVYGGIGLMTTGLGMPQQWLERLPVDSWVLPGTALVLIVAAPYLAAVAQEWNRAPAAGRWSTGAGLLLMGWITVQVAVLQRFHPLQPAMFLCGLATVALSWAVHRRPTPR